MLTQNPDAERMECANGRAGVRGSGVWRPGSGDKFVDAFLHFAGGLVGEGDSENVSGRTPLAMRWAMRYVMTRVLPVPAPARISTGPFNVSTAWRCWRLSEFRFNTRAECNFRSAQCNVVKGFLCLSRGLVNNSHWHLRRGVLPIDLRDEQLASKYRLRGPCAGAWTAPRSRIPLAEAPISFERSSRVSILSNRVAVPARDVVLDWTVKSSKIYRLKNLKIIVDYLVHFVRLGL